MICQHEWKEEYYGWRCPKCNTFYPYGGAPWEEPGEQYGFDPEEWDDDEDHGLECVCETCIQDHPERAILHGMDPEAE